MKKTLLLFSCFAFIQVNFAQGWCKPGATWHYKNYHLGQAMGESANSSYIDGVSECRYVSDTVISGITCNHITSTFRGVKNGLMPYTTFTNDKNYYTYENNKVIYARSAGSFDTIVNFNATIGDVWRRNTLGGICNGRGLVTVTDTGRILMNNLALKKIVTVYSNTFVISNTTYTVSRVDTIIERLMNRNDFMFPMYCETNNPQLDNPTLQNPQFKCYEDDNFLLYKKAAFAKCEFDAVGIGELNAGRLPLRLYPNPSTGNITLESDHLEPEGSYTLKLVNALGQCVLQQQMSVVNKRLQLQLEGLSTGLYQILVSDKSGLLAAEKIVLE